MWRATGWVSGAKVTRCCSCVLQVRVLGPQPTIRQHPVDAGLHDSSSVSAARVSVGVFSCGSGAGGAVPQCAVHASDVCGCSTILVRVPLCRLARVLRWRASDVRLCCLGVTLAHRDCFVDCISVLLASSLLILRCVETRCPCGGRLAGCASSVGFGGVMRWLFMCPADNCPCTTISYPAASRRRWGTWQFFSECGARPACVPVSLGVPVCFLWAWCPVVCTVLYALRCAAHAAVVRGAVWAVQYHAASALCQCGCVCAIRHVGATDCKWRLCIVPVQLA